MIVVFRFRCLSPFGSSMIASVLRWIVVCSLLLWFPVTGFAAEPESKSDPEGSSDRPRLVFGRYSGKLNVPDPVAISVADNGDVYVTQTQRRKIQDLDIRQHSHWISDDVGLSSVDEKRAFYRQQLPIGGDQVEAARNVEDVNQDGQHDWRDLTVISERIHRLRDTDGDGVAEEINVFAENFQTEVTGIAAGVMHWKDSVWATIAPDVWKLTDTDQDGVADQREVIATGFGLHIAYAGHDMHGLTVGPDGKVYWSIGDKGIAVQTPDGKRFDYPNQGGVMRCNPDGSDFEVFAHGLRNVQEVAFDDYGNLFGVDNDADMPGEKERFVWIVDQMDAGWRCNYQYRGDAYNPWLREKLWETAGAQHPAYIIPPIDHYVDGPAGFKYNPGTALSSAYKGFFFLTSAPNGSQFAFRVVPQGDSYRMVDAHRIGSGEPIVGLAFGPDGGLYGVDWGGGYPLNQSGSVIRIDVADDALTDQERRDRQAVSKLLQSGFSDLTIDRLTELLSHADQRVRLRAQFALVDHRQTDVLAKALADQQTIRLARLHAAWGLGQLIRADAATPDVLEEFLNDSDPIIRSAVSKTLGESGGADPAKLIPLLQDKDPHVRVHASLALARVPTADAVPPLLDLASKLSQDQHYLRHAAVTALAACGTAEQLAAQANAASQMTRLCCVVALRRKSSPFVTAFLHDTSDWVATEAARAIHDDVSIEVSMQALAETLLSDRDRSLAMTVRAINANFRIGNRESGDRLMSYAADASRPMEMRLIACEALGEWTEPPLLDRVDGRRRKRVESSASSRSLNRAKAKRWFAERVAHDETELRLVAVKAARRLGLNLPPNALIALVRDRDVPTELRAESLEGLAAENSELPTEQQQQLLVELTKDAAPELASLAIERLATIDPQRALTVIDDQMDATSPLIRRACVKALAEIASDPADERLSRLADRFLAGELPDDVKLDVFDALVSRADDSEHLRNQLEQIEALPHLKASPSRTFRQFALASAGGDPDRGERLFRSDVRLQCSRCHRVGKNGSEIGPELTRIANKRDAEYLLRAVVYPSADIEPQYNLQTILLTDGNVVQGVIKSESDQEVVLVNDKVEETKIAADEIEQIAEKKVSLMPDMTDVFTPDQVRDLVAYLKTLRK